MQTKQNCLFTPWFLLIILWPAWLEKLIKLISQTFPFLPIGSPFSEYGLFRPLNVFNDLISHLYDYLWCLDLFFYFGGQISNCTSLGLQLKGGTPYPLFLTLFDPTCPTWFYMFNCTLFECFYFIYLFTLLTLVLYIHF